MRPILMNGNCFVPDRAQHETFKRKLVATNLSFGWSLDIDMGKLNEEDWLNSQEKDVN